LVPLVSQDLSRLALAWCVQRTAHGYRAPGPQIAEAHGGSLTLENRKRKSGRVATLTLPLEAKASTVDTPIAGSRAGG
jgi:hypothetical protein